MKNDHSIPNKFQLDLEISHYAKLLPADQKFTFIQILYHALYADNISNE